ncbi:exo-alpha-sialidase [Plantactinospora sp. WMMB334]|uniref:exo-alpha-sialidase n=1 Tax=Plantactinospora sp. WMMB334 TaxID=3404119 RepID=UPI003B95682B
MRPDNFGHRRRRRRRATVAAGVLLASVAGLTLSTPGLALVEDPASRAGLPVDANGVRLGPLFSVEDPGPGELAAFPSAFATDIVTDGATRRKVFVAYSRNADSATADSVSGVRVSENGGTSYHEFQDNTIMAQNMARLPDGRLIAVEFIPEWAGDERSSVLVVSKLSRDLGRSWETVRGRFTPPAGSAFDPNTFDRGLRVHRGPVLLSDGTLITPAYTQYAGDPRNRTILLQSTDAGRSWSQRASITVPTAAQGTNEASISRTVDGRLVAVLRTSGGSANLLQAYSADDGRTWSEAVPVAGPPGADTGSVAPVLVLQPNGILLLSYGRPDNKLLISYDGNGTTWEDYQVTFANPPTLVGPARNHGSSGNTSMVAIGANRSLLVGDSCANSWGCKQYHEDYRVWARHVEAVTPGTGKIDLASRERAGLVTLTGTFAARDPAFPESRPQGAFDGGADPRAAARLVSRPNRPAHLTVELDRVYTLNRIGLMLAHGRASDADVSVSTDGRTWQPVTQVRGRTDYALRYIDIAPQPARYLRVQQPAGGALAAVTELELYSDVDSFENDPVIGLPRGFTDVRNATVTAVGMQGHLSERSLNLVDLATDAQATATRLVPDAPTRSVEFVFTHLDFRGAFMFDVRGRDGAGNLTTPWHFNLTPVANTSDVQVRVYDGRSWQLLGVVGGISSVADRGKWTTVSVQASVDSAVVTVAGQSFTTSTRWQPAVTLSGTTIASGGTESYGMDFYVDDLVID